MNIKRLSVPLSDEQHRAIKIAAMLDGLSIKDYILGKIFTQKPAPNNETLRAMQDVEEGRDLMSYTADEFIKELRNMNGDA